jgi:hypothetical protein
VIASIGRVFSRLLVQVADESVPNGAAVLTVWGDRSYLRGLPGDELQAGTCVLLVDVGVHCRLTAAGTKVVTLRWLRSSTGAGAVHNSAFVSVFRCPDGPGSAALPPGPLAPFVSPAAFSVLPATSREALLRAGLPLKVADSIVHSSFAPQLGRLRQHLANQFFMETGSSRFAAAASTVAPTAQVKPGPGSSPATDRAARCPSPSPTPATLRDQPPVEPTFEDAAALAAWGVAPLAPAEVTAAAGP